MGMVMAIICLSKQFRLLLIDDIGTGERIINCTIKQKWIKHKRGEWGFGVWLKNLTVFECTGCEKRFMVKCKEW